MEMESKTRFGTSVAGRHVEVVTGTRSQTVNVCTAENKRGEYEQVYRLSIESVLSEADLAPFLSLEDLDTWLVGRGATREGARTRTGVSALTRPLPSLIEAPLATDPWVREAVDAVDEAISEFVSEFVLHPYLHRVEHSIHARLFELLKSKPVLAAHVQLGPNGPTVQLVHKEWPETIADSTGEKTKRGNFDLAILAPSQLKTATLEQYRKGRIDAPIVIEIGLDYGFGHLQQDHDKLIDSHVVAPYLVHLSRVPFGDEPKTQALIESATAPIRSVYVLHRQGQAPRVKHLRDTTISASGAIAND